jgi:outer membrane protein, heavy metal efflux system
MAFAQPPASTQATGLTLSAATDRALASNPTIAVARLQRPIDAAGVVIAGGRPSPELAYEQSKETPHQAIGATLPIELGGKRLRRIALANATVAVGDADLARVIAAVQNDVRRAYFEVVAATMREQIAEDVRALAQRARDAANARVLAGDVPRSDLTLSDLSLANSENELVGARGEAAATRAELNALLGQPADMPLTLTDPLVGPTFAPQGALDLAARSNGDVQVLDRQIAEQEARVNLAQSLMVPDVAASSTLTYGAQPEFRFGWRLSGGIVIPIFSRHRAGVLLEQLTLARLKQGREALVARLGGSIAAAIARASAARDQVVRYNTSILPLALQAEGQAQAAYDGGQAGLPALVQALQFARDTRQRGVQAAVDYQHALTDLERTIGAPIR